MDMIRTVLKYFKPYVWVTTDDITGFLLLNAEKQLFIVNMGKIVFCLIPTKIVVKPVDEIEGEGILDYILSFFYMICMRRGDAER